MTGNTIIVIKVITIMTTLSNNNARIQTIYNRFAVKDSMAVNRSINNWTIHSLSNGNCLLMPKLILNKRRH